MITRYPPYQSPLRLCRTCAEAIRVVNGTSRNFTVPGYQLSVMLHVGYDFVDKRSITFSHVLAMDKRPFSTVSIIGLEPPRPGSTLWFGLVRTVYPGLVPGGSRPIIDTV